MNLGMGLVVLLVSRDTLFCIGKEMERSTVTQVDDATGTRDRRLWQAGFALEIRRPFSGDPAGSRKIQGQINRTLKFLFQERRGRVSGADLELSYPLLKEEILYLKPF